MCGIAAIFSYHNDAPPVDRDELLRMREQMKSRGPDGKGLWFSENRKIGLAHRRLSIIDLSDAGAQPMGNEDNSIIITYNGEIYNYRELRAGLEQKGYHFRSHSDTEVLLALYEMHGQGMADFLRGMYAFAIWDENKQGLFLARDPFGIKPLYVHDNGKIIRIASQVMALLAGGSIRKEIEPAGHAGFFLWGHVPEPYTLYKDIKAFKPGTTLWIDRSGKCHEYQFWSVREELAKASKNKPQLSIYEYHEKLGEALRDSIKHHLIADVPVGVFLSSGLDSTTIAALASEVGAELRTVTLGFDEFRGTRDDEVPLAEEVARQYGARHQTIWVTKDEFREEYNKLLNAMDQPTINGVNTYFVSLAARKAGLKVALSGLGGDELFGGYPSFQQIPKSVRMLSWSDSIPGLGRIIRRLSSPLALRVSSPKYASLLEYGGSYAGAYLLRRGLYMPWELPQLLGKETCQEGLEKLQTLAQLQETINVIDGSQFKVSALEIEWYMRNQLLRDADWASMAHSLEIRVPLVDPFLLKSLAPIALSQPFSKGKKMFAMAPKKQLPEKIRNRPKTGFTVPVHDWLKSVQGLDAWKSVPALNQKHCSWARRWAYTVMNHSMSGGF